MPTLKWQMEMQGHEFKGGTILEITERGQTAEGAFVVLRASNLQIRSTFFVRYNVNIGGKNYLLLQEQGTTSDDLIPIRMLDKARLSCMDRDRFSSLSRAMTDFVADRNFASVAELVQVLGDLPAS